MRGLISQIIGACLGFWLAVSFVSEVKVKLYPDSNIFGVSLTSEWQIFLVLGVVLGLLNFFVKPVIKTVTLPLRMLTLGIFGIIINIAMIWFIDIMFKEITVPWFWPLFWTTLIIFALNIVIQKLLIKDKE